MDVKQILIEIKALPYESQLEILSHLNEKMKKRERLLKSLDEIRGIGRGLWDMDAQHL